MHRYLVVAHRTLGGPAAIRAALERLVAHGPSAFHIVVPAEPPHDHAWTEAEARHQAQLRLDHGLQPDSRRSTRRSPRRSATPNPMQAVEDALLGGASYDAIVLSTLPAGPSTAVRHASGWAASRSRARSASQNSMRSNEFVRSRPVSSSTLRIRYRSVWRCT